MEVEKVKIRIIEAEDVLNESSLIQLNDIILKEGAVVIKNILNKSFIQELKTNLQICINEDELEYGKGYAFYGMVHALMTRKNIFRSVLEDSLIMNLMRQILGHGAIVHAFNSSSMPPNNSNYAGAIHVDSPRCIPGYITNMVLTIALDDFTQKNGAMEIWLKSFDQIDKPSIEDFNNNRIVLDNIKAGDAIFFNARCWHKGGVNQTDSWRHAIAVTGCRSYMKQQFDFTKMFSEQDVANFSETFKQFMGYHVRIPKSMEEFLLPPEERLYKGGQE